MKAAYFSRVDLLLTILPDVMQDQRLALKGGTAINMFFLEMPRLSVDIDLTYLPIESRTTSLNSIDQIFHDIKQRLIEKGFSVQPKLTADGHAKQLIVEDEELVKIEINHVLRGCVLNPVMRELSQKAQSSFNKFATVQCLAENDVFAGKVCAALDRQHPRDLYDMLFFLKNMGYSRDLHSAFLVYLISNNRPISELIKPNQLNISELYSTAFLGMTEHDVPLSILQDTFHEVVEITHSSMTDDDKEFLLSFKAREPKWNLISCDHAKDLPAIKWKLYNIAKMDPGKHRVALNELERKLS